MKSEMLAATFLLQQEAQRVKILLLEGTSPLSGFLPIICILKKTRDRGPWLCMPVSRLLALAAKVFLSFLASSV